GDTRPLRPGRDLIRPPAERDLATGARLADARGDLQAEQLESLPGHPSPQWLVPPGGGLVTLDLDPAPVDDSERAGRSNLFQEPGRPEGDPAEAGPPPPPEP